eukprot:4025380-Pleurochrysis_carterae.AAC.4
MHRQQSAHWRLTATAASRPLSAVLLLHMCAQPACTRAWAPIPPSFLSYAGERALACVVHSAHDWLSRALASPTQDDIGELVRSDPQQVRGAAEGDASMGCTRVCGTDECAPVSYTHLTLPTILLV